MLTTKIMASSMLDNSSCDLDYLLSLLMMDDADDAAAGLLLGDMIAV